MNLCLFHDPTSHNAQFLTHLSVTRQPACDMSSKGQGPWSGAHKPIEIKRYLKHTEKSFRGLVESFKEVIAAGDGNKQEYFG